MLPLNPFARPEALWTLLNEQGSPQASLRIILIR